MTKEIQAIVVDDEPLACKRIIDLLEEDTQIAITSVCNNGKEAIQAINEQGPDIVFLDIQMPEIDGFEVLKNIELAELPAVVFVTAYDEYALKAFEVHALDYLLKPYSKERFNDALERAKTSASADGDTLSEKLNELMASLHNSNDSLDRLMVKSSGRFMFLNAEEIDWIEADGNYVRIHSGEKNYLLRDTMKNMEQKLDSDLFFRIHRSTIVNVTKIKELEKWFHGDYKVHLQNGEELTLSRNYKELIQAFT